MLKKSFALLSIALVVAAASAFAQNANTSTTTTRSRQTAPNTQTNSSTTTTTTNTTTKREPVTTGEAQDETPTPAPAAPRARRTPARTTSAARTAEAANAQAVRAAFDALIDGITRADVDSVMSVYWNSPQLVLFNNNGTVTKSWAQVRANRESSYPNLKDVKIAVRDVRVQMLGTEAALVTCLWTQTQTYRDTPETATGRLSLVFRRVGAEWKAVHTHTSPDAPDPSRLLPSEQTAPGTTTTTTTTTRTAPATATPAPTPRPATRP
ncbi:MAG TPA: nuclear transport factor 2 family protein [Pyrinomonadaceae bacterium]|jgi:ketosteroid isomerase-like protein